MVAVSSYVKLARSVHSHTQRTGQTSSERSHHSLPAYLANHGIAGVRHIHVVVGVNCNPGRSTKSGVTSSPVGIARPAEGAAHERCHGSGRRHLANGIVAGVRNINIARAIDA